jgi:DEAD/DEAH box helicase domain-containing protein
MENEVPRTLGEVDAASAAWMVHPDAIYLHEAQVYLVDSLDLEHHIAYLRNTGVDYYTEPKRQINVDLLDIFLHAQLKGAQKNYGEIQVTTQVTGFRKIRWHTHENLGTSELTLPPSELQTMAYWLSIDQETIEELRKQGLWSSSPNNYGPGWPATRDIVRARDEHRCQICGVPEEGRAHDVHHKIPFRSFSSPVEANRLQNLITVCPSCHHRVELAVRIRSGLAGLAYVFSNLAPIFLMCDVRDLGVHSDPHSPIAEGQPTVVIYDQIPAGIGLCERLYEIHDELTQHALSLIKECECIDGCPSCVGPSGELGVGGKKETQAILELIV